MNKLINQYKSITPPMKASLWYIICSVIQKGISLFTMPVFARLLSREEYGLINVYNSWMGLIMIFSTLNLQYGSFNTAMIEFEKEQDRYIASIQGLTTAITCSLFLVYICFQNGINSLMNMTTPVMVAMFLQLLMQPAYGFWLGKTKFNYKYKRVVLITLLYSLMVPALGIIGVLNFDGNKGAIRIWAMVIVECMMYGSIYIMNFRRGHVFFDKKYWRYALSFNIPLVPYYLSQCIFNQSDKIMIDAISGRDEAGLYGVAQNIALVLTFVINAINDSFVPWQYKKLKQNEPHNIKKISTGLLSVIMLLLILLILCGPEIIILFGSEKYFEARWVIPPLAAGLFFLFIAQLFINIEFYYAEKKMLIFGSVLSALINIILNAIFIPAYHFVAAGYTSLISFVIFALCNYFCLKHVLKKHAAHLQIRDLFHIKAIVGLSVLFLVMIVGCICLYPYWFIRYGIVGSIVVLMIAERKRVIQVLQRIRGNK